MTKQEMIKILHEKNRVSPTSFVAHMTKLEITERIACHISPNGYVGKKDFLNAVQEMQHYGNRI